MSSDRGRISTRAVVALALGIGLAAGLVIYLASDATTAVLIGVTVTFCSASGLALGNKITDQYGDWLSGNAPRKRGPGSGRSE